MASIINTGKRASGPIKTIAELFEGWFYGHNDETSYVAKKSFKDAIKDRMGQWKSPIYGWYGARSYNIYDGDEKNPDQYEKMLEGARHNDDYPKHNEAIEHVIMGHYNGERGDLNSRNIWFRVTEDYIEVYGKKVFFNDNKGSNIRQAVIDLYVTLLGRQPESERVIEQWILYSGQNIDIIRQGIIGSPEYKEKHP